MKTENKEKVIYETVYIAQDGIEFKDRAECEKYENSARCVLLSKYTPYVIKSESEYNLFDCGSEEYIYDLFNLQYNWQVDLILQLEVLYYPDLKCDELREKLEDYVRQGGKVILIGRGAEYDGFIFCISESVEDRINRIFKNCKLG